MRSFEEWLEATEIKPTYLEKEPMRIAYEAGLRIAKEDVAEVPLRKHMVLKDKAIDWTNDTIKERFLLCIGMLHLHGLMTDSERIKIQARLIKEQEKQKKKFDK